MRANPVLGPVGIANVEVARAKRDTRILWGLLGLAVAIALGSAALRLQANPVLAVIAGVLVISAWHRQLLAWPTMLGYIVVVILFIPIRRYSVGGGLPVSIEPYRLLIVGILLAWFLALLADPETRWRSMRLEAPAVGFVVALLASIALNIGHITSIGITGEVVKQVSFFASFLLIMYFVSSVVTRRRQIDVLLVLLVLGATVLSVSSIVEWRTGVNPFNKVERVVPVLRLDQKEALLAEEGSNRGDRTRATASAQHPIALGAALVLMVPLAIYLYRRFGRRLWLGCAGMLTLGAVATGSRTAVLMMLAELLAFLWMKRAETVRLLPMLVPLIVACHLLVPGSLGTFKAILLPQGGLIAEQKRGEGSVGSGRIADLGPSLKEYSRKPFFGAGFGTRLSSETDAVVNAKILDNEWLGTLLEVGAVGMLCLLWLYVRAVRMLARASKADPGSYGVLLACFGAAITAFAVGMLTYDAFSFIQVTFLSFILMGLGVVALRLGPDDDEVAAAAT